MKITTVEYRQLKSFGNYNNEVVGAVAEVQAGDTPDSVLARLRDWVGTSLGAKEDLEKAQEQIYALRGEAADLKRDLERDKQIYIELRRLLKKHGVKLQERVPF